MTNFSKHWTAFEDAVRAKEDAASQARASLRDLRRSAYRMLGSFATMRKNHHAELLPRVKAAGFSGPSMMDDFLKAKYGDIGQLVGEGWRELLTAIEAGMKEKDFLNGSAASFLRAKCGKAAPRPELPDTPPIDLSPEDELKALREWTIEAKALFRDLRSRLTKAEHQAAKFEQMYQDLLDRSMKKKAKSTA